jgi:hypothetical protein
MRDCWASLLCCRRGRCELIVESPKEFDLTVDIDEMDGS